MTMYLEITEKNSGFMNGKPLYDNTRQTAWDGNTMTIDIQRNGDNMSMSLNKNDLIDILGKSCHKNPLEKRLSKLLSSGKTRRRHKKRRCKTAKKLHTLNRRRQTKSSPRHRRTSKCHSHRSTTSRHNLTC